MPKYAINNTDYTLEVRQAEPNDRVWITDIFRRCLKDTCLTLEDCFILATEKGFLLTVGLIDKMPVSFMLMHIARPSISIDALAVHPEWQRVGIGSAMLSHAMKHAQGRSMPLEISLRGDWIEAQQFVTSRGMQRVDGYNVTTGDGKRDTWYTYLKE